MKKAQNSIQQDKLLRTDISVTKTDQKIMRLTCAFNALKNVVLKDIKKNPLSAVGIFNPIPGVTPTYLSLLMTWYMLSDHKRAKDARKSIRNAFAKAPDPNEFSYALKPAKETSGTHRLAKRKLARSTLSKAFSDLNTSRRAIHRLYKKKLLTKLKTRFDPAEELGI